MIKELISSMLVAGVMLGVMSAAPVSASQGGQQLTAAAASRFPPPKDPYKNAHCPSWRRHYLWCR